jgi:hypothetical protein
MARTRNLKPSFFKNEVLAELDPLARLLFQGLWLEADRDGRLEYRPKKLKVEILPYDNCNVEAFLTELDAHDFIHIYQVGGSKYIQIINFTKHQSPHPNEAQSVIPPPEDPVTPSPSPADTDEDEPKNGQNGQAQEKSGNGAYGSSNGIEQSGNSTSLQEIIPLALARTIALTKENPSAGAEAGEVSSNVVPITSRPKEKSKPQPKEKRARTPDPLVVLFSQHFERAYRHPFGYRKADFVQLAEMRKRYLAADPPWVIGEAEFSQALTHYFASEMGEHTLAYLCVHFSKFHKHAVDRFDKPLEAGNNGKTQTGKSANDAVKGGLIRTTEEDGIRDARQIQVG